MGQNPRFNCQVCILLHGFPRTRGFLSEQYCVNKTLFWLRFNDLGTAERRGRLEFTSIGEVEWPQLRH